MTRALRIALIAAARYPIQQPFAGGLEAHTWSLARGLRQRGHQVTLFAAGGSDPDLDVIEIPSRWPTISPRAKTDVSMPNEIFMQEHHAYLALMLELADSGAQRFDVVHNNSLHYLPVAMAPSLRVPLVTTLHTPPTPWLESAIQIGPSPVSFVAVSRHTADAWRHAVPVVQVVPNGIDLTRWPAGPGGADLVWFGRLVPEKGPELAISAARQSSRRLNLVGPIADQAFYEKQIAPQLGDDIRYLGHLHHTALAELVGRSAASLVTPRWDEPYGLVLAESLACATPIAGFSRGALPEVLDASCGVLVRPDDVTALAAATDRAVRLTRTAARRRAETTCSVETMLDGYEEIYAGLAGRRAA